MFASSIAVFGTPLPGRIDDATAPAPTSSYGTHKRMCELLIDDCTRRGFIDGRALRLPGVVVVVAAIGRIDAVGCGAHQPPAG